MAKRGRPAKRGPDDPRQMLAAPVPLELKRQLEAVAAQAGRSLAAEVRDRLARSLEGDAATS